MFRHQINTSRTRSQLTVTSSLVHAESVFGGTSVLFKFIFCQWYFNLIIYVYPVFGVEDNYIGIVPDNSSKINSVAQEKTVDSQNLNQVIIGSQSQQQDTVQLLSAMAALGALQPQGSGTSSI